MLDGVKREECASVRKTEEKLERERELERAQTVSELVDRLAQKDYEFENRIKMQSVLCRILDQAAAFYAGNNDQVCRGALVMAATAIKATVYGGIWNTETLVDYLATLAHEFAVERGRVFGRQYHCLSAESHGRRRRG